MKKQTKTEEYEQLAIDFGDEAAISASEEVQVEEPVEVIPERKLDIGAKVTVNAECKHFCDGRGVPDYARTAYIKRINTNNKTVVIETQPDGEELGLLFISDIAIAL